MTFRNVLYLHTHDNGRCVEPYGHPVSTPHLVGLADRGTLFRQAFCAGPTCSPSRAALLTGQYPHQAGMLGLVNRGHHLIHPDRHLCHTLKRAGYQTLLAGVQHVAPADENTARTLGYDEIIPTTSRWSPDVAEAAAKRIDTLDRERPFFMSVGFFEPHRTSVGDFGYAEDAKRAGNTQPLRTLRDTPEIRADVAEYHASIRAMDLAIGCVLSALARSGLAQDTLVIYTTDHGPPFPRMKANLTDMGLGVALIIAGPDGFEGGRIIDGMVSQLDIFPTLCEYLQIDPPSWLEGRSLLPLARGAETSVHESLFAEMNYHGAYDPMRCVRTERFKLIKRFINRDTPAVRNCDPGASRDFWLQQGWIENREDELQLYDLSFDPNETNNLAGSPRHAAQLSKLMMELDRWMLETQDPLLYGPLPMPGDDVIPDPPDRPKAPAPIFRAERTDRDAVHTPGFVSKTYL